MMRSHSGGLCIAARRSLASLGATATDHGHATPRTADLGPAESEALFNRVIAARASAEDAELFRAQMLTEMARMSLDDGLVMQIHPGSFRNHNARLFADYGRDVGADIPRNVDYVQSLKPLLDRFGNERRSRSSCLRWTKRPTAASLRRSRVTIRHCGSGRRGGSMTVPRE